MRPRACNNYISGPSRWALQPGQKLELRLGMGLKLTRRARKSQKSHSTPYHWSFLCLAAAKVLTAFGCGSGGKEEGQKSPATQENKKVQAGKKEAKSPCTCGQHMVGSCLCRILIYSLHRYILFQLLKEWVWCKPRGNLLTWRSIDVSSPLLDPVFGPANIPP